MSRSEKGTGLQVSIQEEVNRIDRKNPDAAVHLANLLITRAVEFRASDIHIHPQAVGATVRYRIDGQIHLTARVPEELTASLVTRLKVMAKLVVFQRSLPQDGRIDWLGEGSSPKSAVEAIPTPLRIAFLPTLHGEDVVVRLPEGAKEDLTLDSLGMGTECREGVDRFLERDQGTLLLTGPSSSGKTTTIYAMLRSLHERRGDAAHILTLEDPIEQDLEFAGQVPIRLDQGLGWPEALRSVLRHDPNVILIGEIRDRDTAQIAVEAGLTGHLVISTVHSGRAVGVLVRLVHMEIEPFLVASSVTATIAQRLVRRLCPHCSRPVETDARLRKALNLDEKIAFRTADGCTKCDGTGSRGRIGLFEVLSVNSPIREGVLQRLSESEMQSIAFPDGDRLVADAVEKAKAGLVGMEELTRMIAGSAL